MADGTQGNAGGMMFDTPEKIDFFRLASLKGALKMECAGLRMSRGRSAYATCKADYGLKGNKAKVLAQMEAMVEEAIANKDK
jgi:hypothetical protein